jgi:hypothetical protein
MILCGYVLVYRETNHDELLDFYRILFEIIK